MLNYRSLLDGIGVRYSFSLSSQAAVSMKCLVVDDSKTMRRLLVRMLQRNGICEANVCEAYDGKDALDKISHFEPDLILSDWLMPRMDGYDFLKAIREKYPHIPFGFITSQASNKVRKKAKDEGASFFLPKPFTEEDLSRALDPYLSHS